MPGGGAIYVGTKHGRVLAERLNQHGCHIHVALIDQAIAWSSLALVTKEEAATIERQAAYIEQLESMLRSVDECP